MNKDYMNQESTERGTKEIVISSIEISEILKKHNIKIEEVVDYHVYPIADNNSPRLSADRLEYTLSNIYRYLKKPLNVLKSYYDDLFVSMNEDNIEELAFRTPEIAASFTLDSLKMAKIYASDEDRFSMEYLATIINEAIQKNILNVSDLYLTELNVINKLKSNMEFELKWNKFCAFHQIHKSSDKPEEEGWLNVPAKKRIINPLVKQKRISSIFNNVQEEINNYKNFSFNYWIKGE